MRQSSLSFFDPSKQLVVSRDNRLPALDGSSLTCVKPSSVKIWFTTENSDSVIWDEGHEVATVAHGLGCFPIVSVFDEEGEQLFPTVTLIDGLSFTMDFGEEVYIPSGHPCCCVVGYQSDYGDSTGEHDGIATAAEMAQANAQASQDARDAAIQARNQAAVYAQSAQQAYQSANALVVSNSYPLIEPTMQGATLLSASVDNGTASIQWSDAPAYSTGYGSVSTWKSTILVVNYSHLPESVDDGEVLVENTVRDAYSSTPFTFEMEHDAVFIRLFTRMFNDSISPLSLSPGQQLINVVIESLGDFMEYLRDGEVDVLRSVYPVGSTLPFVSHSEYTLMTYLIGHYDYTGNYSTVSDYLNDENRSHNVILIPATGIAGSNGNRIVVPYDLYEKTSALSQDTSFVSGKTYYTTNQCTSAYNVNNAQEGDTPVSLGLYEKGRIVTANTGYGVYEESFMRQFLTSDAASGWYNPLNIFEPASHTFASNHAGFLYGLDSTTKSYMHPARNMYLTYRNVQSIVYDAVFLPNNFMMMRSDENGFGQQLEYFRRMTTNAQRIQRDPNGAALYAWSGSQANQPSKPENLINLSTEGAWGVAGKLEGGSKQLDGTVPFLCLA